MEPVQAVYACDARTQAGTMCARNPMSLNAIISYVHTLVLESAHIYVCLSEAGGQLDYLTLVRVAWDHAGETARGGALEASTFHVGTTQPRR